MNVHLIEVPYDSGWRNERMGRGPLYLSQRGIAADVRRNGFQVHETVIESSSEFRTEIGTTFELLDAIAMQVKAATIRGEFPVVLAGNCNSTVGAMSGLNRDDVGLVWFDAHGDFNTPETSTTGFLDAMGLSMVTGRCWTTLTAKISDFRPLADSRIVLVGAREFDETELERLEESELTLIPWTAIRKQNVATILDDVLRHWSGSVNQVYIHVDLDVHDAKRAPANHFTPAGGLDPNETCKVIREVGSQLAIAGASITAFDPKCDVNDVTVKAARRILSVITQVAAWKAPLDY